MKEEEKREMQEVLEDIRRTFKDKRDFNTLMTEIDKLETCLKNIRDTVAKSSKKEKLACTLYISLLGLSTSLFVRPEKRNKILNSLIDSLSEDSSSMYL